MDQQALEAAHSRIERLEDFIDHCAILCKLVVGMGPDDIPRAKLESDDLLLEMTTIQMA